MTFPNTPDIRWKQRLSNYQRAYLQLVDALAHLICAHEKFVANGAE
jgi:hypothetical protein